MERATAQRAARAPDRMCSSRAVGGAVTCSTDCGRLAPHCAPASISMSGASAWCTPSPRAPSSSSASWQPAAAASRRARWSPTSWRGGVLRARGTSRPARAARNSAAPNFPWPAVSVACARTPC
eukprot:1452822-Prymnesium_polylepis.1